MADLVVHELAELQPIGQTPSTVKRLRLVRYNNDATTRLDVRSFTPGRYGWGKGVTMTRAEFEAFAAQVNEVRQAFEQHGGSAA